MAVDPLIVDNLELEVRFSPRRKTLGLTVGRGGELIVAAPEGTALSMMEQFVREKRFWIYTKLAQKEALSQHAPTKEFVTGEGFPYLGRSYRLLLVDEQSAPLKLEQGRFKLLRAEVDNGRAHFIRWYADHGKRWIARRVGLSKARVGVKPTGVEVRDLGFRWGSCGAAKVLNFHWATILLPARIVDYVIIHELVHLAEPHHTPEFWQRVERAMPDFQERKGWLAEHGGAFVSL
jgi:predicted metal-dependent hydrolase